MMTFFMTSSMSTAKRMALIASGYAVAVVGGLAAVMLNELYIAAEIQQRSGGMVAFGDMVLFVLAAGFFGLVPTWFLLEFTLDKAPRVLPAVLLFLAATGPVSWLALVQSSGDSGSHPGQVGMADLGLLIAFIGMPRIIAAPVLLVVEGAAILLAKSRLTRGLLAAAMLMDLVPLAMFALHMARLSRY